MANKNFKTQIDMISKNIDELKKLEGTADIVKELIETRSSLKESQMQFENENFNNIKTKNNWSDDQLESFKKFNLSEEEFRSTIDLFSSSKIIEKESKNSIPNFTVTTGKLEIDSKNKENNNTNLDFNSKINELNINEEFKNKFISDGKITSDSMNNYRNSKEFSNENYTKLFNIYREEKKSK